MAKHILYSKKHFALWLFGELEKSKGEKKALLETPFQNYIYVVVAAIVFVLYIHWSQVTKIYDLSE